MKQILAFLLLASLAFSLPAETNEASVKLAIISESPDATTAADVLTAEFSKSGRVHLLERTEIEKIYREQGFSAANKDYLKLGQLLGADGLLLMETVKEGTNQFLNTRLIAVQPGVVLVGEKFIWPVANLAEWSSAFAGHLNPFFPKLSVLVKDAIPISIVNLRSAVSSAAGAETERHLKLLTIQRLSREPQFFVLERQRMQLLGEEKDLKLDDSPFWNGSYLLEGVVDQNGFAKDTITINARLTPPKGGTPLLLEVSGGRANLGEVVNRLAAKVNEALKVNSPVKEWNSTDEAVQYFDEAGWALRWGVFQEAQAAADSAWALGKCDQDCAIIRIRAYAGSLHTMEISEEGSIDASLVNDTSLADRNHLSRLLGQISRTHAAVLFETNQMGIAYLCFNELPDPKMVDRAAHVLALYHDFTRTAPGGAVKLYSRGANWKSRSNTDWYQLGIDCLVAASKVLQDFNAVPESQKPVADELAELRGLTREVAKSMAETPSEHDGYFVGDRFVTHDELANTIEERPNIFSCKLTWGALWQETPEDCLAQYRELMSSPVFCYIHQTLWAHQAQLPQAVYASDHRLEPARLVAWHEAGRQRIPSLWAGFVQELEESTNALLRLEAKAIRFADATDKNKMGETFTNFFDTMFADRDLLVTNHVEVLYLNWGADGLVNLLRGIGPACVATPDALQRQFYSDYRPRLEAMDREFWDKTVPARQTAVAFEKQKQYLAENKSYDFFEFVDTFRERNYSQPQALEIRPLLAAYKSNLVAQSQNAAPAQKGKLLSATFQVGFLENDVSRILHPSPPRTNAAAQNPQPRPATPAVHPAAPAPARATNILAVDKFLPIPLESLTGDGISQVKITAHHWFKNRLLLDFQYNAFIYSVDVKGNWKGTRTATRPAIAILDPATRHWEVISCPEPDLLLQSHFYHRTVLLGGEIYNSDGGQIQKYDLSGRQRQVLPVSDGGNYELFAVNDRLYAANSSLIFEIIDSGKSTRILASTRRQPPVSVLDREDLGTPALFEGPGHSLRVRTKSKIFTWTGNDWREDSAALPSSLPPVISGEGVLFRTDGFNLPASISSLAVETNAVEFLVGFTKRPNNNPGFAQRMANTPPEPKPLWKLPAELSLTALPAAGYRSDLYLLEDHSELKEIADNQHTVVKEQVIAKDGYHSALWCFTRSLPSPQKILLNFIGLEGCPPVTGSTSPSASSPAWISFSRDFLIFGLEKPNLFLPGVNDRVGIGYQAGIWLLPVAQIEKPLSEQRQKLQEQQMASIAAAEQAAKNLVTKYDLNHNGAVDQEEREAALDDAAFIESELDNIDANKNGWLDAEELAYFDANTNKILDPKEQAGIEITQRLLAQRLLEKFDANQDGKLDRTEFTDLFQTDTTAAPWLKMNSTAMIANGFYPDANHDQTVDAGELETYLKQYTRRGLGSRALRGAFTPPHIRFDPNQPTDPRQAFKMALENYWQKSASTNGWRPVNQEMPAH